MIKFISNGVNVNVPHDYVVWLLFLRKLKYSELNSFLSEVLIILFEGQVLFSDLLHPSGSFCFEFS